MKVDSTSFRIAAPPVRSVFCETLAAAELIASTIGLVPIFAVRMEKGPSWDASRGRREQDAWNEHAAFMDGLVDDGFVILGGPIGDGEQTMHAIEAEDERAIETRFAADPWAPMGMLQIAKIEPWTIWLDGRS
jgi:uncharacterized protein